MKLLLLTANDTRHRYVANQLGACVEDMFIVSECKKSLYIAESDDDFHAKHFLERREVEARFFGDEDCFLYPTLPVPYKDANTEDVYNRIKKYDPDLVFVYGSSIIREPLLSLPPKGRFINMHLGISPYYRGSGTNFWPFVNDELEYVGATLLHIDPGIDTGDIAVHVTPEIEADDTVHSVGCKVIQAGAARFKDLIEAVRNGHTLNRVKQWDYPEEKYYRKKDFTEAIYHQYHKNIEEGMVQKFVENPRPDIRLINNIVP